MWAWTSYLLCGWDLSWWPVLNITILNEFFLTVSESFGHIKPFGWQGLFLEVQIYSSNVFTNFVKSQSQEFQWLSVYRLSVCLHMMRRVDERASLCPAWKVKAHEVSFLNKLLMWVLVTFEWHSLKRKKELSLKWLTARTGSLKWLRARLCLN